MVINCDIAISDLYGIGKVIDIVLDEDVWNPICVEFNPICMNPSHQHIPYYTVWFDCNGEGSKPTNTVRFYTPLNLKMMIWRDKCY